jgi:hypothetical protein
MNLSNNKETSLFEATLFSPSNKIVAIDKRFSDSKSPDKRNRSMKDFRS